MKYKFFQSKFLQVVFFCLFLLVFQFAGFLCDSTEISEPDLRHENANTVCINRSLYTIDEISLY